MSFSESPRYLLTIDDADILKKVVLLPVMIQIQAKKYGEHLQSHNLKINMEILGVKPRQSLEREVIHGYLEAMIQNLTYFLLEHLKQSLGLLQVEA